MSNNAKKTGAETLMIKNYSVVLAASSAWISRCSPAPSLSGAISALVLLLVLAVVGCSKKDLLREQCSRGNKWGEAICAQRDSEPATAAIERALELKPGQVVWDIGSGAGYWTRRLALALGPQGRVIATDVNDACVDYIETASDAEWGVSNVSAVEARGDNPVGKSSISRHLLQQGAFDVVDLPQADRILLVNSLEFSQPVADGEDARVTANEMTSLEILFAGLKPGGRLVYYMDHQFDRCAHAGTVLDLFESVGFDVVEEFDPLSLGPKGAAPAAPELRCRTFGVFSKPK